MVDVLCCFRKTSFHCPTPWHMALEPLGEIDIEDREESWFYFYCLLPTPFSPEIKLLCPPICMKEKPWSGEFTFHRPIGKQRTLIFCGQVPGSQLRREWPSASFAPFSISWVKPFLALWQGAEKDLKGGEPVVFQVFWKNEKFLFYGTR